MPPHVPVVGQTVHYYRDAVQRIPIAAIITGVAAPRIISLTAFPPGRDPEPHTTVSHASLAAHDACRWEWPPTSTLPNLSRLGRDR